MIFLAASLCAACLGAGHTVDSSTIVSALADRPAQVMKNGAGYAGYSGKSFIGDPAGRIWLSPMAFKDARAGGGKGLLVLLHEVGHVTGIASERQATCYALAQLRPVLRMFFGVIGREATRRARDAAMVVRTAGPEYREGACT